MKKKKWKARLKALERELQLLKDRDALENLAARYQYYRSAGEGQRILDELWARETENVTFEVGPSGVFIGLPRLATYYMNERRPGRLIVHTLTTQALTVAPDGRTAEGLWLTIGTECEAGDLGPAAPEGYEERQLLTSEDEQGRKYRAEWVWQKFRAKFIRESDGWRIQHLHQYEVFRCPYDSDPVRFAELRKATDGLRSDAIFTPEIEPELPPGFPREYNPELGSSYHWQYGVDAVPELVPEPPGE